MMVIKEIMKNEGLGAFFKGLTPKVRLLSYAILNPTPNMLCFLC